MTELKAVAECKNGTHAFVDAYPDYEDNTIVLDFSYIDEMDDFYGTFYKMTKTQAKKVSDWIMASVMDLDAMKEVE